MQIKKRILGKTHIEITPIGLGGWQFSGNIASAGYWASLKKVDIDGIVKSALDSSITWFDTAEIYGFGRSERALSHALVAAGKNNGGIVIATKWFPALRWANSITKTIDKRLKCLDPFGIDLYQIHNPMSFSSIEDQMDAMADLLERSKIKAIGISNFSEIQMRRAHKRLSQRGFPLASTQMKYNLLDRSIEKNGVLSAAKELGITVIAYSPLQMGLLSGKFHRRPELIASLPRRRRNILRSMIERSRPLLVELENIALIHNVTPSQVALSWLVNFHGESVVAIPGATEQEQAVENAAAMSLDLSKSELDEIDKLSHDF